MPIPSDLYSVYEPRIRALPRTRPITDADLSGDAFRIEKHGRMEIYYAPMDWVRPNALHRSHLFTIIPEYCCHSKLFSKFLR
jgi:hypothetical protein